MNSYGWPAWRIYLLLLPLASALFVLDLATGPATVNVWHGVLDVLQHRLSVESMVLLDVRLPRALLAALVGGTLGFSGAALQGLLRNPLAEPGIIGVSNFAALGAVIVFYFGFADLAWYMLPLGGLLGALVSVLLLLGLTSRNSNLLTLILAGVAINAIGGALIALALNFAPNPYAMQEIVFWLLGSVTNRSINDVWIALPFLIVGWLMLLSCGRFLNGLSLGEETAHTLGFHVTRQRWVLVLGVAACVGAAVAVCGNIGFVGLVVPHVMRPLVGSEPRRLLAVSFWGGVVLLLLADIGVQVLSLEGDLKLGVVTALVGAPFFLWLILRSRSAASGALV